MKPQGTTLMLSMVDFGSLIGNPTVGGILRVNEWLGSGLSYGDALTRLQQNKTGLS